MYKVTLVLAVLLIVPHLAAAQEGPSLEAGFADGQKQKVTHAGDVVWGPCPPTALPGCQMAVLEGNPREHQLFTVRFKVENGFEMQAHTHPRTERVTVLDGTISVGFGDELDISEGTTFGVGDYYVNAPETAHYVWSDGPFVIQITGIGPWVVEYLED